ncbi:MAG: cytochrome c biogenesis protein CcsA [Bacteroidales bacterium]|jgi:cytochrome c-type biogenesis protein CcsB|nr:cytochrome c biogenesis protein CcsA [Bacteroidales bacterium]
MRSPKRKINSILFSNKTTIILLLLLGIIIGIATFIENHYDTFTSRVLIYNTKWFEAILVLLSLNLLGNIKKHKLFRKEKVASFILHIAFIIMIVGAGITRYFGFEGDMHIRENESSNLIFSLEPYFQIKEINNNASFCTNKPVYFSQIGKNPKYQEFEFNNNKTIKVSFEEYIRNAEEIMIPHIGDKEIIELSVARKEGIETVYIKKGAYKKLGNITFSYDNNTITNSVNIKEQNNAFFIQSPYPIRTNKKSEMAAQIIKKDSIGNFKENHVYSINGEMFLFVKYHKYAKIKWVKGDPDNNKIDVLLANIELGKISKKVELFYDHEKYVQKATSTFINDCEFEITYGPKPVKIPFSIHLNNFTLNKYSGSQSPSSYLSEVVLIDKRKNLKENHSISKNNVLDHDGYRFFQTLYDEDEKGTILSVNHDFYGTLISYIGYFLLGIGFLLLMLSKKSRFNVLSKKIKNIRLQRKELLIILFTAFSLSGFALTNNQTQNHVLANHAEEFGKLLVQSYEGRFAPVNSLAYDVMHKISKKDKIILQQNERMDAMHVFLDMLHNPLFWKQQDIIYVGNKSIRDILGISNKYASFNDFFNEQNRYKLENYLQTAFNKKPKEQTKFNKEIIKLTERVNICIRTYNGSLLKIFPEQNSTNNKWIDWSDPEANKPLTGKLEMLNADFQISNLSYRNIMQEYVNTAIEAQKTGNYSRPNQILGYIENIQRQSVPENILPSRIKINIETFYNKANIFIKLKYIYGLLGFVLMIFSIVENFNRKKSKLIQLAVKILVSFLALAFAYHTFGLGLRWYLTNHAPWSNGYETLLLVAWGALLAGFTFTSHSKITLSGTAILAFLILMTAGHSYYDPHLTNLQPVLKSYWLIFHVATITIGYAFLGLGFLLGIINMNMFLFKSQKNNKIITLVIQELSYINEKSLFIGLFLATVGTFLGGIWANESWGRYWGWDPKETWSLIIILCYTIVLHFRLIPKMKSRLIFNISSVIAFGSVLMTFFGLNYYFRKSLHSYATDDPPVFPFWAWVIILLIFALIGLATIKEKAYKIKDS